MKFITLLFVFLISAINLFSQNLVYNPINPSFAGGNYLNASWLLASATAQNHYKETSTSLSSTTSNSLDDFKESLKRSLLSQISRSFIDNAFGENGIKTGKYEIGDFLINISNGGDGINIDIFDNSNGGQTTLVIPFY